MLGGDITRKKKIIGKAEKRQEANEGDRSGQYSPGGIPCCAESR